MLETIRKIISNVLQAIYQPFFFALILSVLVMFFVMYLDKYTEGSFKDKLWAAAKEWKGRFASTVRFRRGFYLVFCAVMVLFKTLLNRNMWANPISDVIGIWGFKNANGDFTTEIVENVVLFVPLVFFLFWYMETRTADIQKDRASDDQQPKTTDTQQPKTFSTKFHLVMIRAIVFAFVSSLSIEMLQLVLRLGTWQLSDLFFNTLGGIIGGLIYWISAKARRL